MNKKIFILTILAIWLTTSTTHARIFSDDTARNKKPLKPYRKFFVGNALDGVIVSSALIKKTVTMQSPPVTNTTNDIGIARLTAFLNTGLTFNWNLARHFGIWTGLDVKNIGFIEKNAGGETVKRRTYNLGVPFGIKIGNMVDKNPYLFLGGGADAPFNYREKTFVIRDQKAKFSEWFSQRTPSVMPYVFAGFSVSDCITLKFQYYPGNFLNTGFTTAGTHPYTGYNVNIFFASIGYAVPLKKQKDSVELLEYQLKTNKL